MKNRFDEHYIHGTLPWDLRRPDANLIASIERFGIKPCHAADIGCGTGDNVFWMHKNGFDATGIDFSEHAIEIARKRSREENLKASFFVADILKGEIPESPYRFVFDRGCFHTFDSKKERSLMAKHIHKSLEPGGHWLSLIGNYDDGRLEMGPPKRTVREVVEAVEPWFEILLIEQDYFDSNQPQPSKIWLCFMRKRETSRK